MYPKNKLNFNMIHVEYQCNLALHEVHVSNIQLKVKLPAIAGFSCLRSSAEWIRASFCLTGLGSSVRSAPGGISPRSSRLIIPYLASSSVMGGGASCGSFLLAAGSAARGSIVEPSINFWLGC